MSLYAWEDRVYMLNVTQTTISFKVPEENDAIMQFVASHDMTKWNMSDSCGFICYTRSESLYCSGNRSEIVEVNLRDVKEQTEKEAACY